jgi:hypothetical protein
MTAPTALPSKPTERGASTTVSQRDRRWTDTFFDDYRHPRFPNGRPFTGEREFKSGVSEQSVTAGFLQSDLQCGEYFCEAPDMGQTAQERQLTLDSAWSAPFLLPGGKKYMNFNYAKKRIVWRYDAYIADERSALARLWEACALAAGQGELVDPAQPDALAFRLRKVFGNPRSFLNKIRIAQACQAGDPWIMGAVNTPNEELAKLLGLGTVQYLGSMQDFGDSQYVAVQRPAAPEALLKPEAVTGMSAAQVAQVVADAIAAHEAQKKAAHAEKSRLGKERAKSKGAAA